MRFSIIVPFKRVFLIFLLLAVNLSSFGKDDLKSLVDYLDGIMTNKPQFANQKEQRINGLKDLLTAKNSSLEYEYELNLKLYDEYKKFKLDSAIYYIDRNLEIADQLNNTKLVQTCEIQLASLFSYSGMHREAEEILKNINSKALPKDLLADYYEVYARFFEHYSAVSSQHAYYPQIEMYRDSLINVLDSTQYRYKINLAHKYINMGRIDDTERVLLKLLDSAEADSPEYALITHYLGAVNRIKKNSDLEIKYYTLSAIVDTKNAIKENASFQRLATIYYEKGDIDRAFRYTQSAIEDAVFSGVQFRTAQMMKFYSIINASYQEEEAKSKSQLQQNLILISVLTLFFILLVIYVYLQMRRTSRIKEQLSLTNDKLTLLNDELNASNDSLSEANHIKEQYIVHFLDLCSDYIDKMEDYRKELSKIALNNQFDKLMKKLKSTEFVDDEVEELYKNFDSVFLSLYPTFVSDFNALLAEDEQIILKSEDLLNKELRIYALLRLGITDSIKISTFLRCSISTVYNYRTKIRNKAIVSRDDFENIVMKIGGMHLKRD